MAEKSATGVFFSEDANRKLEQDVEQKRLLAERKELVTTSHEMKTPLGVIRAYAEGLKTKRTKQNNKSIPRSS